MSAMPSSAPAEMGQAAEQLKLKLRPDLVIQEQTYEGIIHYVIKDPIALKYFRFKNEEYFLLKQFDGRQNLLDIKRRFESKYRPQTISIEDLTRFAAQLHEAGLVQIDTAEQAQVLVRRRRKRLWKKAGQFLANILYIKIPVFDPEKLLGWMHPYFKWIYSPWFMMFSLGMMLAAITLVVSQWTTFYSKLPTFESFFNWWTLFYFWTALGIVKIIHEFGHGLTAKHYGSEVHEMGMLFLILTPCLYCDVTDSWLLRNKWHRIWISAAGIYVECFLASLATFVWWNTSEGLLNSLMMATMFICSVNTILFNANPLLRYDGYYVLSDWLEVPNLRIKSTQFFAYLIQEKVLGLEIPVQSYLPKSRKSLFVIYAVASYFYRWLVTISILFFLYQFLKPYGLQSISATLAIGSAIPLLFMPMFKIIKWATTPGRLRKMKKGRAAAYFTGFAAAVALIMLIPTPLRVQGTLKLTTASEESEKIYIEVPGQLVELKVRDGQYVKAGDVLAVLSNPDKQRERLENEAIHDTAMVHYNHFLNHRDLNSRRQALQNFEYAKEISKQLDKQTEEINKLVLVAGRDGQAIGVPSRDALGKYLEAGLFCEVGNPKRLEAHLILDQSDIELIKEQCTAWVKIYGKSEDTYKSYVSKIAKRNRDEIPPELSNLAGGEIATEQDQQTGAAKPISPVYEVVIPIDNLDMGVQPEQRGFAKIHGGHAPLYWWAWRLLNQTFRFM